MSLPLVVSHASIHAGAGEAIRPGVQGLAQITNKAAPNRMPEIGDILELLVRGFIPPNAADDYATQIGVALNTDQTNTNSYVFGPLASYADLWAAVFEERQKRPEGAELREIANRQVFSDLDMLPWLRKEGYYDSPSIRYVTNLRYDIPGPADLVRFSVRHVWEPDLLAGLGYNAEFPGAIIDAWHSFKGLDYSLFTGPFAASIDKLAGQQGYAAGLAAQYQEVLGEQPTWAKAYWWSHWVLPSPSQFFQMWIRLNPDRDRKWDGPEMVGTEFTYEQMLLGLRANDYPPMFRPLLAAINRPVPGIRYARDFRRNNVYNYQDLYNWALRQGYTPQDSLDIANDIEAAVAAQENKDVACKGCREVESLYETGIIDEPELLDFYQSLGMDVAQAQKRADLEDLRLKGMRARQVVSTIRSRYLSGELSDQQARGLLTQFGIVASRIDTYVSDWSMEKATRRKQASAQQNVKWACDGYLTVFDLGTRLTNLGYAADDVQLFQQQANDCNNARLARIQAQIAAAQAKSIRQLQQAARAQAAAFKSTQRQLASHGSPAQLRKWFCEGHITELEVFQRLNYLGWPDVDIGRLIGDCKQQSGSGSGSGTPGP